MRRVAIACLTLLALIAASQTAGHAQSFPLRRVEWPAVLAHDPYVTVDNSVPPSGDPATGAYIVVDYSGLHLEGYAVVGDVRYGDLDADGAEEAVMHLVSGGAAGQTGLLVYHESTSGPRLVAVLGAYKMNAHIVNGRLVVSTPNYVGFEPNCCPSSLVTTTYVLGGDGLAAIGADEQPEGTQALTVEAFYQALDGNDFAGAYAFFSPAYQAAHPFDGFADGYATTVSIRVQTGETNNPNVVRVQLTATDSTPGGGTVTRRFAGAWTLFWSSDAHRWVLDRANIAAV